MSAMIMNPPHRKPLPQRYDAAPNASSYGAMQRQPPMEARQPSMQYVNGQDAGYPGSYSRTPTMTSQTNTSPMYTMTAQQSYSNNQPTYNHPSAAASRRTLSNATSSTSSSQHLATAGVGSNMHRVSTNSTTSTSGGVRRSTSSRSNSSISPTSYVALMRKQKATVWCDRAQHEDPRILAAQRQAKMRAAAEVAGGHNYLTQRVAPSSQGMVGGVRSKIRHHGAPKASAYTGLGSAGVPIRMSASEVDDIESDDESAMHGGARYHSRTGSSGRSSVGSGRRLHSFQTSTYGGGPPPHPGSAGFTPPTADSFVDSMADLGDEATPMPTDPGRAGGDYFSQRGGTGTSGERGEETFGTVGQLPRVSSLPQGSAASSSAAAAAAGQRPAEKTYSADELRRRGSVDDRSMTMSGVRLFVANPDLSD